jgi:HD-GYP domain-containing protein (c-di-GMP phosphodiesterase class II)
MEQTKKKLDVSQLEVGMYVCELDRPWLETPFLLQGFPLRTPEDIAEVRNVCEYVYIDVSLGKDSVHSIPATKIAHTIQKEMEKIPNPDHVPRYPVSVTLEKEIKKADNIQKKTRGLVQKYLDDLRTGKSITPDNAKEVVTEVVDSIIHNPSALMCYTLLQNRDERTSDHSMNVCILALAFGRYLGLSEDELNELGIGALLHDLGKVKIPMEILHKTERLTDEEFNIIRQHPVHGRVILEEASGKVPQTVIDVTYSHHERANGSGYPQGLLLKELHLFVKIVAIVDVYDAITSDRSYHDGISSHDALKRMYEWRETDFDPDLLEKFIQCLGIYPIGTIVELNTGDIGVVVEVDPRCRLKPRVMLIMDPDKQLRQTTRIIDLAMDRINFTEEDSKLEIIHVLDPGVYDGNIMKAVFESELMQFKNEVA